MAREKHTDTTKIIACLIKSSGSVRRTTRQFTKQMKQVAYNVGVVIMSLVLLDLIILAASIGQIGIEGRTGEWNDFWLVQAKFVLGPVLN